MRNLLWLIILLTGTASCGGGGSSPASSVIDLSNVFVDTTNKTQISCPVQTPNTFVAVVFGQSNGANSGDELFDSNAINYFNGKCYLATSPMLNASGNGGSMWPLLAGKLEGFDNIIFITISVGGTSVKNWTGNLAYRLDDAMKGYTVTDFIWDQGEADNGKITQEDYASNLQNIINKTKNNYPQSRFWVTLTSINNGPPDFNIRAAQISVVGPGVFQGPDTDSFDTKYRLSDGVHFNARGQEAITDVWKILLEPK